MTDRATRIRNADLSAGTIENALGPAPAPDAEAFTRQDTAPTPQPSAPEAEPAAEPARAEAAVGAAEAEAPPPRFRRRALNAAYRIPALGRIIAITAGIVRLPAHIAQLRALAAHNKALTEEVAALQTANQRAQRKAAELESRLQSAVAEIEGAVAEIDRLIYRTDDHGVILNAWLPRWHEWSEGGPEDRTAPSDDSAAASLLERRLEALRADIEERLDRARIAPKADGAAAPLNVPEAELQRLYDGLEEAVRGDSTEIKRRLAAHLPLVERAVAASGEDTVLDLGCGRGDWLALLGEHGYSARGVDSSNPALDRARAFGLAVTRADVLDHLAAMAGDSVAVVSAIHLAEHLPFDALVALLKEAYRVLAPGGALLIETPNPANLVVGAHTFWIDPTHRAPLPPELLDYLLRAIGFGTVETRFLTPDPRFAPDAQGDSLRALIHERLLGPYDYATAGWKPAIGAAAQTAA